MIEERPINLDVIRNRLSETTALENKKTNKPYGISMSMGGISRVPLDEDTLQGLIAEADKLLYEQKEEG